jgi:hypothetical protein
VLFYASLLTGIITVIFVSSTYWQIIGISCGIGLVVSLILFLVYYLYYVQVQQGKVIIYGERSRLTLRKHVLIRGFTRTNVTRKQWKWVSRYHYEQYMSQDPEEKFIDLR